MFDGDDKLANRNIENPLYDGDWQVCPCSYADNIKLIARHQIGGEDDEGLYDQVAVSTGPDNGMVAHAPLMLLVHDR